MARGYQDRHEAALEGGGDPADVAAGAEPQEHLSWGVGTCHD
jgi:hypothetical protein